MKEPEFWLRGPVAGVPALLQPVAHALLQAEKEVTETMNDFPPQKLWSQPAGLASAGFHLQHLSGVLDRLFTYARGESLRPEQLQYLRNEGQHHEPDIESLLKHFHQQVQLSIDQLKTTDVNALTDTRMVGRAGIPSTLMGLLFHAAEHTMRHTGQLLVTANFLKAD